MRRGALAVAVLLLLAACNGMDPAADIAPTPVADDAEAAGEAPAPDEEETPAEQPRDAQPAVPQTGTLEVRVVDRQDRPRPGVPIAVEGPQTVQLVSAEGGVVRAELTAGHYNLRVVPGCTDTIEVLEGGTGAAGVAPGQVASGVLVAGWRHRFVPGDPTGYTATDGTPIRRELPRWRPNVAHEVTFTVLDRCRNGAPAPNASYASFRFVTSENVRVLDTGTMRSNAQGIGRVRAECFADGVINMNAVDTANESEQPVDLLVRANEGGGRPFCSDN